VAYALKANSANALDAPDGDPTNAVFVNNNGNVGVGTTNPSQTLEVVGAIKSRNASSVYKDRAALLYNSKTGHLSLGPESGTGLDGATILLAGPSDTSTGVPGGISFITPHGGPSRRAMIITDSGNVGIGTSGPTEKLVVVGNIFASGSITPGSSRELKENIADLSLQEAVAAFENLKAVKFNYKADEKKDLHIGFIAEEVPELLATPDRKGVNSMDVVAVLTKVMQEQQKEIAALREEVNVLKQQQ
jgi:hypothetical protein